MAKTYKTPPLVAIIFAIVSIFFLSQLFSNDFRIKILNIFRTPLKLTSGVYYALRDASNFKEISTENEILKRNINNLKKEITDLHEVRLENKRLKELLGFRESKKRKYIPAMVIARDPFGLRDTIIIDKGKKDNVRKDMVVVSGNGLVGRVRESGQSISRVLLVTDRDSIASAVVQRTRDEGAVIGSGGGLTIKYLELTSDTGEGDKVVTSGFGGVFEKGILIGAIDSMEIDVSGLYLNATIEPEVDMERLEEVLIIR